MELREAPPQDFALDGLVAEWGPIEPSAITGANKGEIVQPSPSDRRLALVVTEDGVVAAGKLGAAAVRGFWLGLGSELPEVSGIGYFQRGGGIRPLTCEDDEQLGEALSPEEAESCRATLDRHKQFVTTIQGRFARRYWVDSSGIRELSEAGGLTPVKDARVALRADPTAGSTVELSLPLSALPYLSSAPMSELRVLLSTAPSSERPAPDSDQWAWYSLPADVSFEPLAALRGWAIEQAKNHVYMDMGSLFYDPSDPLQISGFTYLDGGLSVGLDTKALATHVTALGDLRVAIAYARASYVVALRGSDVVGYQDLRGEPMGLVQRGADVHAISLQREESEDGRSRLDWSVLFVKPDGSIEESWEAADSGDTGIDWVDATEFHDPSFRSFGLTGHSMGDDDGRRYPLKITWTWSAAKGRYVRTSK